MVGCGILGCKSRSERKIAEITFHSFPSDPEIKLKWIIATGRLNWQPTKYSKICSVHFENESIINKGKLKIVKPQSVPTKFISTLLQENVALEQVTSRKRATNVLQNVTNLQSKKPCLGVINTPASDLQEPSTSTALLYLENKRLTKLLQNEKNISANRLKKLRAARESRRRLLKKTANLENILTEVKCRLKLKDEELDLLSNIECENKDFLKRFLLKDNCPKKYSPALRKFALCLHFISPKAYMFVRKQFNTCLPHPQTLYRWYKTIDCEPGFTTESFQAIKIKYKQSGNILCCLSLDEMAIRQHLQWDGKQTVGYVNVGNNLETDNLPLAKDALVFMLTALNGSWKLPVGYFLTNGVDGNQRSSLLKNCVHLLNECGVKLVSITFDGCPANFAMVRNLGAQIDNLESLEPIITIEGQTIVIVPDACHMIKLVRNTLADKKEILNSENKVVSWHYIEKLNVLQQNEGLYLANKVRNAHVHFRKQKMKVRLAAQTFSKSVADALLYLKEVLVIDEFVDCGATIEFIRYFNDLFDILNSRRLSSYNFKQPISTKNFAVINLKLQEIENYLLQLKFSQGDLVIKSGRKTGFMGFLISIKALKIIYETYINIKNAPLEYLCTYKMSQDHLEIFFSAIRSKGGFNNNPTALQFTAAYKRLLIHGELKNISTGNCIPLDTINILNCNTLAICKKISSRKERLLEMTEDLDTGDLLQDMAPGGHDYNENCQLSEYGREVTIYIAGFITRNIGKIIKCENCLAALFAQEKFPSFILHKDIGGLYYPSKDVISITVTTEQYLRHIIKIHGISFFSEKNSASKVVFSVLKKYLNSQIFPELSEHVSEQGPFDNHLVLLIKAISFRYLEVTVRLHHLMKSVSQKSECIRSLHTKLVLFKGQ